MYWPLCSCMARRRRSSQSHVFFSPVLSGIVGLKMHWVKLSLDFSPLLCTSHSHRWRQSNTEIGWKALCKLHWSFPGPASHLPPILMPGSRAVHRERWWWPEMVLCRPKQCVQTHTGWTTLTASLIFGPGLGLVRIYVPEYGWNIVLINPWCPS